MEAACVGMITGSTAQQVRQAVSEFNGVEHRLEPVATIKGVAFFNDSKATNVDATIKALESFPGNIHIILVGKDKGSDYSVLNPLLRERAKRAYVVGDAAEKNGSQIKAATPLVFSRSLESAITSGFESAV